MMRLLVLGSVLLLTLAFLNGPAHADCVLSATGQTRPPGTMVYESAQKLLLFCADTVWKVAIGGGTTGVLTLPALTDVDDALAPTDGQVLLFSSSAGMWQAGSLSFSSGGNLAVDLPSLTDVDDSLSPADGQILRFTSSSGLWEAADPASASETDPQVGATTNNNWCRGDGSTVQCDQTAPTGGNLPGLTDVTDSMTPTDGQILRYNDGTDLWEAADPASAVETDPQVGSLTNSKWCTTNGTVVDCTTNPPLTSETDPQVGATTNNNWCRGDGSTVQCDQTAPAGDNLGNHTAAQDLNLATNDIINTTDIVFSGVLRDTSDIRLKTDVAPLGPSLAKIAGLEPISFRMKSEEGSKPVEYGFSAQDVRKIYPDLVVADADEQETLSLNYLGLVAPMVEAIKELKAENDALRARVDALEHARSVAE